jgi:hypothetical protein
MNSRLPRLFAATLTAFVLLAATAHAQTSSTTTTGSSPVLVYKIDFSTMGDSINFRSYQGGYLVFDVGYTGSNTGTVILTQVLGGVRKYYTIANYGQMFYATKGNNTKAVFSGNKSTAAGSSTTTTTSSTATSTASATTTIFMYGIGDADKKLDLELRNGEANLAIASELEGYGIFTDSQEDLPFASASGEDVGTAGTVSLHLKYDEGLSTFSEKNNTTRTAMVTKIQQELVKDGYVNGDAATTTTGTGTGTGTGSTGGTGTGTGTGTSGR